MTKICSKPSFGGKVKPSAQCFRILRHVKEPYEYEETFRRLNWQFTSNILLLRYQMAAGRITRDLWWTNQEFPLSM
jgi:hypothetical protein